MFTFYRTPEDRSPGVRCQSSAARYCPRQMKPEECRQREKRSSATLPAESSRRAARYAVAPLIAAAPPPPPDAFCAFCLLYCAVRLPCGRSRFTPQTRKSFTRRRRSACITCARLLTPMPRAERVASVRLSRRAAERCASLPARHLPPACRHARRPAPPGESGALARRRCRQPGTREAVAAPRVPGA